MSEQAKTELSCGEHGKGGPWYPLRKWWQSSRLFNQDVGLPPFLEPGDPWWMNVDWLQRSLAASPWPGYIPAPLFVPHISGSMHHPSQKISEEQYKWRVCLDVAHFSPSEISLSIKDGFLEVGGKHEERPDEHGFIARCFTRKYRLPAETDSTKVTSTISADGILTVEAPVPEISVPAVIIIPIKVEMEAAEEQEEKQEKEDTAEMDQETPEVPEEESPPEVQAEQVQTEQVQAEQVQTEQVEAEQVQTEQVQTEQVQAEQVQTEQAHPGSDAAEPQQHEERREQEEETHEKPDGESHPSGSGDAEVTESLQDSSEHDEAPVSQESPVMDTPEQPEHQEHQEPAAEGESQVMAGSAEGAEGITQPTEPEPEVPEPEVPEPEPQREVPSQQLEAPGIKQEHTE